MEPVALGLVVLSAFLHVFWNALIKKSSQPELFTLYMQIVGSLLAFGFAIALGANLRIPWQGYACALGTGIVYGAYYTTIAKSYERGDLSLAYPIARGVAPIATAILGMAVFAERPNLLGYAGIGLVVVGVLSSAFEGPRMGARITTPGVLLALGTGLCTALYSAFDKQGVKLVNPVLYLAMTFALGSVFQLGSLALRRVELRFHEPKWGLVIAAATACTLGYCMVLYAMRTAPLAYVVPARSVSVLLSVLMGAFILKESVSTRRFIGACTILAGIIVIGLAKA